MEFHVFLSKLYQINSILKEDLYDYSNYHKMMSPKERLDFDMSSVKDYKQAAVLALFYPKNNQTYLLLTLRANYNGTHASQISFPGGKTEKSDKDLIQTALRETNEEVGITANLVTQIIPLSKVYIPPSNFMVSPFIGIVENSPDFIKNYEVDKLIEVKLTDLLDSSSVRSKCITTSYAKNINIPYFKLNNHVVWGATAMILSEIKELVKLSLD